LGVPLEIAANEAVFVHAQFEGGGAGIVDGRGAVLLGQGQSALDAANGGLSLLAMHGMTERADMASGAPGADAPAGAGRSWGRAAGQTTHPIAH